MARKNKHQNPVNEPMNNFMARDKVQESSNGDTVIVALNRPTGIIFKMPDGRRVTINGNATHLRGKDKATLPVGAYGLTSIDRADWEYIKKTYGPSLALFKTGLLFAADKKADALDMADEREDLRNGLEPVDTEQTKTAPYDGKE